MKDARIVILSLVANNPILVKGIGLAGLEGSPNILANNLSFPTERPILATDPPTNLGYRALCLFRSQMASTEFATIYVPEYTPQINRNDGCFKNAIGLVNRDLNPLSRQGKRRSLPLAFETIALSTIDTAGAIIVHIIEIRKCYYTVGVVLREWVCLKKCIEQR